MKQRGAYIFDCSGFLVYLRKSLAPLAEEAIPHPGHVRPLAEDFYDYFLGLSTIPNSSGWSRVEYITNLNPGDIIAWLKPPSNPSSVTGHVMLVAGRPQINPERKSEILITVIDSTSSPHANDSRAIGITGLGKGIIGILTDKERPIGYYWRGGISRSPIYTKITFGKLS